jgi:hypothetical protein
MLDRFPETRGGSSRQRIVESQPREQSSARLRPPLSVLHANGQCRRLLEGDLARFRSVEELLVKSAHELLDRPRQLQGIIPEERYFSMPSGLAKLFWHYNDGGASSNPTDPGLRRVVPFPGGRLVRSDPRARLLTIFPAIQSKRRSALMAFSSGASNQRRQKLHNARQTST